MDNLLRLNCVAIEMQVQMLQPKPFSLWRLTDIIGLAASQAA